MARFLVTAPVDGGRTTAEISLQNGRIAAELAADRQRKNNGTRDDAADAADDERRPEEALTKRDEGEGNEGEEEEEKRRGSGTTTKKEEEARRGGGPSKRTPTPNARKWTKRTATTQGGKREHKEGEEGQVSDTASLKLTLLPATSRLRAKQAAVAGKGAPCERADLRSASQPWRTPRRRRRRRRSAA